MKTTSNVHTGITTAAVVKVPPTPITAIPDTSNMTAAALPRGYKKDGGQTCHYCGYSSTHPTCPARGQLYRNCHKTNHFVRLSKPVRQIWFTHSSVSPTTSSDKSVFMIIPPTSTKTPKVTTLINDSPVLDTGASVNIISGWTSYTPHDNSIICLQIPTGNTVRGFIDTTMKFRGKCCRAKIFVVDDESPLLGLQNLLSAHSTEALGMMTFNFTFHVSAPILDKFPSLFDGKMGKISGVIINLHIESSVPPVMQQHCRIPFHVRKYVEAELKSLREMPLRRSLALTHGSPQEKQGCMYLHQHEEGK